MPRSRSLRPELSALRVGLRRLQQELARMARKARRLELAAQLNGSPAPRRTLSLSAARRAQLKLQGEYMGTMRQLSAADKKKVRAIKEKRGHRAAIEAARALRRKRSR